MAYDIRLPNITATTEKGQLEQMRSYLYQFAEQLKYAVNIIDDNTIVMSQEVQKAVNAMDSPTTEQKVKQFSNLKNLIISSADIINTYYEEISRKLEGKYEALSPEFGIFKEETENTIRGNSEAITANFKLLQSVNDWVQTTSAYVKTGRLGEENGIDVYGIEVGQTTVDENGGELFSGMSRFTATKTSFYDGYGNLTATLSNQELTIDGIVCKGRIYAGGFVIDTSFGFAVMPSGRVVT